MAQPSITTKYAITATTGTAGFTFNASGRTTAGILQWRQIIDSDQPSSDSVLTASGAVQLGKSNVSGWKSNIRFVVPVMENIATNGDANGYLALPKVQAELSIVINVYRPSTMTQALALQKLDELAYAMLTDAALRKQIVGYQPADT